MNIESETEIARLLQITVLCGLPFEVRIPNEKTRKTIEETKARKGLIHSDLDHLRNEFK